MTEIFPIVGTVAILFSIAEEVYLEWGMIEFYNYNLFKFWKYHYKKYWF